MTLVVGRIATHPTKLRNEGGRRADGGVVKRSGTPIGGWVA